MMHAALGVRAHSGWAAAVVVAGPFSAPAVVDRRRIEIADPSVTGSRQPYHAAAQLDARKAEGFAQRCADSTSLLAERAVHAVIDNMRERGYEVVGGGILLGSGRPLPGLTTILASHALIHTAEGELFRGALTQAIERCGVPVRGVRERELWARGEAELHRPVDELRRYVAEMGRRIGPPWRQDEKHAALVGWLALAAASRREVRGVMSTK
jgi:hypothetical protein